MRRLLPSVVALAAFFTFAPLASLCVAVAGFFKHWGGFTCVAYFWTEAHLNRPRRK